MQSLLEEESREYALSGGMGIGIMPSARAREESLWQDNCLVIGCPCNGNRPQGHDTLWPVLTTGDITQDFVVNADGTQGEEMLQPFERVWISSPEDPEEQLVKEDAKSRNNPKKRQSNKDNSRNDGSRREGKEKDDSRRSEGSKWEQSRGDDSGNTLVRKDGQKGGLNKGEVKTKAKRPPLQSRSIRQGNMAIANLLGNPFDSNSLIPDFHSPAPPPVVSPSAAAMSLPTPPPSTSSSDVFIQAPITSEDGPASPFPDKQVGVPSSPMVGVEVGNRAQTPIPDLMEVDQPHSAASHHSDKRPSLPPSASPTNIPSLVPAVASAAVDPSSSVLHRPHPTHPTFTSDFMDVDRPYSSSISYSHTASKIPSSAFVPGPSSRGVRLMSQDRADLSYSVQAQRSYSNDQQQPAHSIPPTPGASTSAAALQSTRHLRSPPQLQINSVPIRNDHPSYKLEAQSGALYTIPETGTHATANFPDASWSLSLPPLPPSPSVPIDSTRQSPKARRTKSSPLGQPVAGVGQEKPGADIASGSKRVVREKGRSTSKRAPSPEEFKSESKMQEATTSAGEERAEMPAASTLTDIKTVMTKSGQQKFLCPQDGCGKTFTRKNDVRRHMASAAAHRDFAREDEDSEARCKICNRVLSRGDSAKRHQEYGACGKRTLPSEQITAGSTKDKKNQKERPKPREKEEQIEVDGAM